MMKNLLPAFLFCFISASAFFAQELRKDAVAVAKSDVIEEMQAQKEKNPQTSARKLAAFGNVLLAEKGYEFTFAAEQSEILVSNVEVDSDDFEIYKLTRLDGKNFFFATKEHGSHPCGTWTGLTVTKLNSRQMTILTNGKFYPVIMPKELIFDDIELVEKDLKKTIRRWLTPLDATPEAISKDGKIVYVPTEIEEILLGISDNGSLSFVPANDKSIIKKNTEVENFPKDAENDYLGYKKFSDGKKTFFLKFSHPCT